MLNLSILKIINGVHVEAVLKGKRDSPDENSVVQALQNIT